MSSDDLAYYRERSVIERHRALTATNPRAAQLHAQLASLYESLLDLEQPAMPVPPAVEATNPPHVNGS